MNEGSGSIFAPSSLGSRVWWVGYEYAARQRVGLKPGNLVQQQRKKVPLAVWRVFECVCVCAHHAVYGILVP